MLPLYYITLESAITDQFYRVFATLKRKFNVLCLHDVLGTHEDLSIDASITNDMDKARLNSFLRVQTDKPTDTILESSNGNMSARKKFQLNT